MATCRCQIECKSIHPRTVCKSAIQGRSPTVTKALQKLTTTPATYCSRWIQERISQALERDSEFNSIQKANRCIIVPNKPLRKLPTRLPKVFFHKSTLEAQSLTGYGWQLVGLCNTVESTWLPWNYHSCWVRGQNTRSEGQYLPTDQWSRQGKLRYL